MGSARTDAKKRQRARQKARRQATAASSASIDDHAAADQARRDTLRRQLLREGLTDELAAKIAERDTFDRLVDLYGLPVARAIRYAQIPEPDDRHHRPAHRDPLLHGTARATCHTCRYYRPADPGNDGTCRLNPPMIRDRLADDHDAPWTPEAIWPLVAPHEWCAYHDDGRNPQRPPGTRG